MDLTHDPIDEILKALQERAKELNCLYQVDERLARMESEPGEVLRSLLEIIPSGWQFPAVCRARIIWEDSVFELRGFQETPWVLAASIFVEGRSVGKGEVFYTQPMPRADEGPFLKEERKLIDTVAERISHHLMQRTLKTAMQDWQAASRTVVSTPKQGWWVIIEFLRHTDRHLLIRLSRVFERVKLPDGKLLIPGVIESKSNFIEHPELIAQRIGRDARLVGRENVIAGSDCGYGTWVGQAAVDPDVVWAKLAAMAEGARLAWKQFWK